MEVTHVDIKENIAATLREEMQRRKLSTEAFARFLGVGKTSLQNYMRGKGNPGLNTLELIAEKLGLSMEELLFRRQPFSPFGRAALNAVPGEIMRLHPYVRSGAQTQLLSLQFLYDLSDNLSREQLPDRPLPGERMT